MCAPVSNKKPAAGDGGLLPPGAGGARAPILPDGGADREQLAEPCRCAEIWWALRICGERLPGKATTSSLPVRSRISISPRASSGVHHHRFFEQHVQAGFQAGFGLLEMDGVRGDDESRIERYLPAAWRGRVGWAVVSPRFAEDRGCKLDTVPPKVRTRLTIFGGFALLEHLADVMARHPAAADHRNA